MSDHPLPGQMLLFDAKTLCKPNPEMLEQLKGFSVNCKKCVLRKTCSKVVFGEGNGIEPPIAFVGEAPGANEDEQGRPFVGRAGQLLDDMLKAMGLTRAEVYICNTVNCRPPENRKPAREEIAMCSEWLLGQLRAIQPKTIVALGATAANALMETKKDKPLGPMRGAWHEFQAIPMRVSFHPAYLLRNPNEKVAAWDDLQAVMNHLKQK